VNTTSKGAASICSTAPAKGLAARGKEDLYMSELGSTKRFWGRPVETEVPGKAVYKGKELKVDGVTIPTFSWGLVKVLQKIGLFGFLLHFAPEVLRFICQLISPDWSYKISPGHWYLFRTFGKPGVLKDVRYVSSKDAFGIVYFLRKPGCISNTWILSGPGDAKLIKMVSKKYGSDAVEEFENKSAEEIVQILKVLHSQAAGADRAWPGLKRKSFEAAKKK
jgi:hypothetical protein